MPSAQSRTYKSLRNSSVAMIFYLVALVLEFFSRKIFLDHLGEDVLGLNTTAQSLLQFLNIAEMSIGAAIAFALYRPLFAKDHQAISEIISLMGHFYRRVAIFVIAGSAVLMCFFPQIFSKMTLPLWYAYVSYGALLTAALISYWYTYKQVILAADQQNYKIQFAYRLPMLIKVACQMAAVKWLDNGFVCWAALEAGFAGLSAITISLTVRRSYPYLRRVAITRELRRRYRTVYIKIKQLLWGRVAGVILAQTSPLIIYAYIDLALVAIYGNYLIIVNGLCALLRAVFNDMDGGVGNLVASSGLKHILEVFREIFCVRFMISAVLTFGAYMMTQPFIELWIGPQYLLGHTTLVLICMMLYVYLTRYIVESFIGAYGIYGDIFAPIVEAALNIGLSIWLGYYWGLNGILVGVVISLFLMVICWKPYYLYLRGFRISIRHYIGIYARNLAVAVAAGAITLLIFGDSSSVSARHGLAALGYGALATIVFAVLLNVGLFLFHCGMERFADRMYSTIFRRR